MTTIALLFLGGTIAMRRQADGARPAVDVGALIETLRIDPSIVTLRPESVMNVPSGHLTMGDLYALARRIAEVEKDGAHGIVVIQGTDTIEESAFALDLMHRGDMPVVVTGAMRLASDLSADGPGNIRDAVMIAGDLHARGRGVMVALNGAVHAARLAVKSHTIRTDTFVSRSGAPVGLIAEGQLNWTGGAPRRPYLSAPAGPVARVPLVKSHVGDDGFLAGVATGIDGLVFEGLGGGHAHPAAADVLERLARTMPVVLATRCADGPVLTNSYAYTGGDVDLIRRGLIPCGTLSGPKARMALNILLDGRAARGEIDDFFRTQA